jgi:DNA-binding MarR family transcriptional regulator
MSHHHTDAAWAIPGLTGRERLALLALARRADAAGECTVRMAEIAEALGVTTRSARATMSGIEARGLFTADRSSTTNKYALAFGALGR